MIAGLRGMPQSLRKPAEEISWVVHESAAIRFTCADTGGPTIAIEVSRLKALLYRPSGGYWHFEATDRIRQPCRCSRPNPRERKGPSDQPKESPSSTIRISTPRRFISIGTNRVRATGPELVASRSSPAWSVSLIESGMPSRLSSTRSVSSASADAASLPERSE